MEIVQVKTEVADQQAGPIQNLYRNAKSYLRQINCNQKIESLDQKFQNLLSQCDKVVLKTTNKIRKTKVLENRYINNIKGIRKYADSITDKIIKQVEGRLDGLIGEFDQKQNTQTSRVVKNKNHTENICRILKKSNKLKKLILAKVISQVSKYSKSNSFIKKITTYGHLQRIPKIIFFESKIIYNVISQLITQIIQKQANFMKVTYEQSKQTVIMIINYKVNQQEIKQKFIQGLQNFKNMTVTAVQKGLQIKVDRQFLITNYKSISLKLIELIRSIKLKSQLNVKSVSSTSKQIYSKIVRNYKVQKILMTNRNKPIQ